VLLTDLAGQPLWRRRILIGAGEEQETYIHIAEEMTRQALTTAEEAELRVCGIGLVLPGLVDVRQGELRYAPGLRLGDAQFRNRWTERFDLPVIVENNANAGALAEFYFGVARDITDFIYISSEPGIGGGILAGGVLLHGENGFAGEIGHMCIVPDGETCGCGKRGCWETLIGPKAVIAAYYRRARKFNGGAKLAVNGIGLPDLAEAASLSDVSAGAVLRDAGKYLGIGIANLVNIFNPKIVILGGALGEIGDTLIPVARETVKEESLFPMRDSLTILPSAHGTEDSVLGAVALVLDGVLRAPV
jgi:predicted NBD/HSP70 family sugar kinase